MIALLMAAVLSLAHAQYVPTVSSYPDPNVQVGQMAQQAMISNMTLQAIVANEVGPLQEACDAGDGAACLKAAQKWETSGAVDAQQRAHPLFVAGCARDNAEACRIAADHCATGHGVTKDPVEALRLAGRACELGTASSCVPCARAHERGDGVPASAATAASFYQRACDGRVGDACKELGRLTLAGGGDLPADAVRSEAAFRAACELGSTDGCDKAGDARKAAGDVEGARELYGKGCTLGWRPACDHAKALPKH